MREAGEPMEAIIGMMRAKGTSKVMSIKLLAEIGVPIAEAKTIVHESQTWSDVRTAHDRFAAWAEQALDELGSDRTEE
jgi:hypothetical protein